MRRILVVFILISSSVFVYAQDKEFSFLDKKNEVKLNLPVSIFGAFPEASYERILAEDTSLGASLGFSADRGDSYSYKFQFTPYFRWFFGGDRESARKYAAGFFMELNASVFSRKMKNDKHLVGSNHTDEKKYDMGGGLGLGIGWKYATNNNWVGEILLGGGRDFSSSGNAYPRFGISIGKRF